MTKITLIIVGFQATMIATVVALAFSIWIGLGAVFHRTHDPPLPSPIYNCTFTSAMIEAQHRPGSAIEYLNATLNLVEDESRMVDGNDLLMGSNGSMDGTPGLIAPVESVILIFQQLRT